jgi:hypothetical protein
MHATRDSQTDAYEIHFTARVNVTDMRMHRRRIALSLDFLAGHVAGFERSA